MSLETSVGLGPLLAVAACAALLWHVHLLRAKQANDRSPAIENGHAKEADLELTPSDARRVPWPTPLYPLGGTVAVLGFPTLSESSGAEAAVPPSGAAATGTRALVGDWEYDAACGLFWSETEGLYFDAASNHFYHPLSEQWFDPAEDQWYTGLPVCDDPSSKP
jgi:hypothetical protein